MRASTVLLQKYISEVDSLTTEQLKELVAQDMNEYIATKKLSIKMLSSERKARQKNSLHSSNSGQSEKQAPQELVEVVKLPSFKPELLPMSQMEPARKDL